MPLLFPVGRRGYAVLGCKLEGVYDAQYFEEVSASRSGVSDGKLHLFIRPDYEEGAHRKGFRSIRVDHVVEPRYVPVGIGDDWEFHFYILSLVDVFHPALVLIERIHADGEDFYIPFSEFIFELCGSSELSRAYRRIIGRVGEKHAPAIAEEFMKVDVACSGFGGEIGGEVA